MKNVQVVEISKSLIAVWTDSSHFLGLLKRLQDVINRNFTGKPSSNYLVTNEFIMHW